MKELLLELLKSVNIKPAADGTIGEDQIGIIASAIEKSGKLIPESKFVALKKERDEFEVKVKDQTSQLEKFANVDVETLKKTKEEFDTYKKQQAEIAEKAKAESEAQAAAKKKETVLAALEKKLTEAGSIDAKLVSEKVLAKAGGADKIEFNADGTIKTDIDFAINHVKNEHATNFKEIKANGGASVAGAGGNRQSA